MTTRHAQTCDHVGYSAPREDILHRLTAVLRGAWTAFYNRRAVMQLTSFDEHMLRDIGLTKADVDFAISGSLWSDPSEHLAEMADARKGLRYRRTR